MTRWTWSLGLCFVLGLAGCSAIVSPSGSQIRDDAGTSSSDGGRTDSARPDSARPDSSTPATDGGGCAAGQIVCGGACISPSTDVRHCGSCSVGCASGEACVSGSCTCPAGASCSGGPSLGDPSSCGTPSTRCQDTELCVSGSCHCRPGLDRVSGACVDLSTDPNNCGRAGNVCPTGACTRGTCVPRCPPFTTDCGGACVDVRSDTLNCGGCGQVCGRNTVCLDGNCQDYAPPGSCTSCPCSACTGDTNTCCTYPGGSFPVCVEGRCG